MRKILFTRHTSLLKKKILYSLFLIIGGLISDVSKAQGPLSRTSWEYTLIHFETGDIGVANIGESSYKPQEFAVVNFLNNNELELQIFDVEGAIADNIYNVTIRVIGVREEWSLNFKFKQVRGLSSNDNYMAVLINPFKYERDATLIRALKSGKTLQIDIQQLNKSYSFSLNKSTEAINGIKSLKNF